MHTDWNRPLLWSDVEQLNAINLNGALTVTFQLKLKAPPFARRTL